MEPVPVHIDQMSACFLLCLKHQLWNGQYGEFQSLAGNIFVQLTTIGSSIQSSFEDQGLLIGGILKKNSGNRAWSRLLGTGPGPWPQRKSFSLDLVNNQGPCLSKLWGKFPSFPPGRLPQLLFLPCITLCPRFVLGSMIPHPQGLSVCKIGETGRLSLSIVVYRSCENQYCSFPSTCGVTNPPAQISLSFVVAIVVVTLEQCK